MNKKTTQIIETPVKDSIEKIQNIENPYPQSVVPTLPVKLSVDYASESLNNMARTINELIDYLDAVH